MTNGTPILGNVTNEATTDERLVRTTRQIHGPHAGHRIIGVRHLLFDFEVARSAQSLHNEAHGLDPGRVDRQTRVSRNPNRRQMGNTSPNQFDPVPQIDQTARFLRIVHDGDDDGSEQFDGLLDHVQMSIVERIETARIQGRQTGGGNRRLVHALITVAVQPLARCKNTTHARP